MRSEKQCVKKLSEANISNPLHEKTSSHKRNAIERYLHDEPIGQYIIGLDLSSAERSADPEHMKISRGSLNSGPR